LNLSDPSVEEALYESRSLRGFVGIDLGREPVLDETAICKFRHLIEKRNLGDQLFLKYKDLESLYSNSHTDGELSESVA